MRCRGKFRPRNTRQEKADTRASVSRRVNSQVLQHIPSYNSYYILCGQKDPFIQRNEMNYSHWLFSPANV